MVTEASLKKYDYRRRKALGLVKANKKWGTGSHAPAPGMVRCLNGGFDKGCTNWFFLRDNSWRSKCAACSDTCARYSKTPAGKATLKRAQRNEKGRARQRKYDAKLTNRVRMKLHEMLKESRVKSATVLKLCGYTSEQLRAHLESTWEPWMTWENHGMHRRDGKKRWNIGHRIPCAEYDEHDPEDLARCFHFDNLFAQEAFENVSLGTKLPVLEGLEHVWPKKFR